MSEELVHLQVANRVATITLDSPANRNALSRQLTSELEAHVKTALADASVHVIALTGSGTVFCSGADLKEQRVANETQAAGQVGPGGSCKSSKTSGVRRSRSSGESMARRGPVASGSWRPATSR